MTSRPADPESVAGFDFPVLASIGASDRAREAATRAQQAAAWLAELLDFEVGFRLLVLTEADWGRLAGFPLYGMPHTTGGDTIVVGADTAGFFDELASAFWPDLSEHTRAQVRDTYGDPPRLGRFADLLVIHELAHLFHEQVPFNFPRLWLDELFANLGLYGYLASNEPEQLPVVRRIAEAAREVPAERMPVRALDEMDRALEAGPLNYSWHELLLIAGAKSIWDAVGGAGLRDLHRSLREPAMSDADIAAALRRIHPEAERIMTQWPR